MDMKNKEEVKLENGLIRAVPIKKFKKLEVPNPAARNHALQVAIYNAEGIDPLSSYPEVQWRNYRTVFWVNSLGHYVTGEVVGYPNIEWNEEFGIRLIDLDTSESNILNLEVVRVRSSVDPGPSSGVVVVGRARVPLPEVPRIKQVERVGLVRFVEGKIVSEGHIVIAMKLVEVNEQWLQVF
ncbi:hypothetical protein F3Y22_tig00111105pilonHSYRG00740 [Hibiscus syriacus]|uniref:C2 domain-containing protein n=1 Tax=Hibiscus syriacus TaxID=106335 RepID=A0A6A2YZ97_HIBSY|nr:hypothetical protein F3Y22_tig00111105pilonHSYRG00740 [Hibiscus syriacus]